MWTKGLTGVHHRAGCCPGHAPKPEGGSLYAITRMGPLCDLVKVGMTQHGAGDYLLWRPGTIVALEAHAFARGSLSRWRRSLIEAEAPRAWLVRTTARKETEVETHRRLARYRPPNAVIFDRFGAPVRGWGSQSQDFCAAFNRGTDDDQKRAAQRVCTGREMFRADIGVVLEVLQAVTGNQAEEMPL